MNSKRARVMLLVDADNVSADVMEQAMEAVLRDHGAAHIRRAYCTPESAVKNASLFKRLSLRPMVNLSTGKNATDIALAIDGLDLAISERPEVAVIVSSDSDFAPLVLRLREKGCRVEGIGQQGKTGEASKGVYDAFLDLAHRRAGAAASRTSARSAAAADDAARTTRRRATATVADEQPAVDLLLDLEPSPPPSAVRSAALPSRAATPARPARKAAPRRESRAAGTAGDGPAAMPAAADPPARARKPRTAQGAQATSAAGVGAGGSASAATPAAPAAPSTRRRAAPAGLPDAVDAILKAVPSLAAGQPVALGIAAERLRAAGLLARNAASTRLFARHAAHFILAPTGQPNTVQFVRG